MEACTVTAPDAITAFAVPNPNHSSQSLSVFSGLVAQQVARPGLITQSTSDWLILFEPILSIVDGANVNAILRSCQCPFLVQSPPS